jgi:hypothetical protein
MYFNTDIYDLIDLAKLFDSDNYRQTDSNSLFIFVVTLLGQFFRRNHEIQIIDQISSRDPLLRTPLLQFINYMLYLRNSMISIESLFR